MAVPPGRGCVVCLVRRGGVCLARRCVVWFARGGGGVCLARRCVVRLARGGGGVCFTRGGGVCLARGRICVTRGGGVCFTRGRAACLAGGGGEVWLERRGGQLRRRVAEVRGNTGRQARHRLLGHPRGATHGREGRGGRASPPWHGGWDGVRATAEEDLNIRAEGE